MKIENLKPGNVVEFKSGNRYLVCDSNPSLLLYRLDGLYCFYIDETKLQNIIKVYKDYTLRIVLWKHKEKFALTKNEKVILESIMREYNWITRDKRDCLYVHTSKPVKVEDYWRQPFSPIDFGTRLEIFDHLFKFIKWEDEEPHLIEDLLKEEEYE